MEDIIKSGQAPENLSYSQMLVLTDDLIRQMASWLKGASLQTTLFTNAYMYDIDRYGRLVGVVGCNSTAVDGVGSLLPIIRIHKTRTHQICTLDVH